MAVVWREDEWEGEREERCLPFLPPASELRLPEQPFFPCHVSGLEERIQWSNTSQTLFQTIQPHANLRFCIGGNTNTRPPLSTLLPVSHLLRLVRPTKSGPPCPCPCPCTTQHFSPFCSSSFRYPTHTPTPCPQPSQKQRRVLQRSIPAL